MPAAALASQFFRSAFSKRNPLNIPGPFYGAETDTCETGIAEAPHNVLLDPLGQEFVFMQPRGADELQDIISAAICECFVGYGADGDDHWTLTLIREWWRSRLDLLALSTKTKGLAESRCRWERILSGEGEAYLREYAFLVENGRLSSDMDALPEI
ncbi:MAG: ferredoxin [Planctomycetota bacterium]|nr:ferredoxin [Planctomycetota bacterium]